MATGLAIKIRIARTTNVYGRASASRTIHMAVPDSEIVKETILFRFFI
jgi:hypothetical protein